jgi:CHAD domain-containing protein
MTRAPSKGFGPAERVYRVSQEALEVLLTTDWCTFLGKVTEEHIEYYDTFDFRLFDAGYALESRGGRMLLRQVLGETILYDGPKPGRLEGCLPWDLPAPLRDHLEKTLCLRAIGLVGAAAIRRRTGRIEDDNRKTIARIELEEIAPDAERQIAARFLLVLPLGGYRTEVDRLFDGSDAGLSPQPLGSIIAEVARWHGRGPGMYCSRPHVRLDPMEPAVRAVSRLLRAYVSIMRQNEEGIVNDIDTEFLHDYRVALRRSRSLVSEVRNVLDEHVSEELRGLLRIVSCETGPLRDLDVLLLSRDGYMHRIPDSLRPGMGTYFERVEDERALSYNRLRNYLRGDEYAIHLRRIAELIEGIGKSPRRSSLRKVADRSLAKRLRRVERDLDSLSTADVSEIARHEVRIQCKKLRYLMEALAPAYPKNTVNRAIRQLKQFQDALGRLQDVAVQQESLLAIIHGDETIHPMVAAAIGALVSSLTEESTASIDSVAPLASKYRRRLRETRKRMTT